MMTLHRGASTMFRLFENIIKNIVRQCFCQNIASLRIGKHRIAKKGEHRPPLVQINFLAEDTSVATNDNWLLDC